MGSLDVFEQEDTLAGLPVKFDALRGELSALHGPHIGSIRQNGLMAGIVLQHDHPDSDRIGHRVCMAAREHGVIVRPLGNVVVVMPALAMTPAQIHAVVAAVGVAIDETLYSSTSKLSENGQATSVASSGSGHSAS
jgi:adenosylmethionine-8-amino-7-oxononanoate aminotransferase